MVCWIFVKSCMVFFTRRCRGSSSFVKIGSVTDTPCLKAEQLSVFHGRFGWNSILKISKQCRWVVLSFVKSVQWKPYVASGRKLIFTRTFHIYCPIRLKFGIRDLHMMLLSICEFRENRYSESDISAWMKFCSYFLHLSSELDKIPHRRCAGYAVAQSVEALHYTPEICGFDGVIGIFSLTQFFLPPYGSGIDSASNRNEYTRDISWG
jgi:hypothetical protein